MSLRYSQNIGTELTSVGPDPEVEREPPPAPDDTAAAGPSRGRGTSISASLGALPADFFDTRHTSMSARLDTPTISALAEPVLPAYAAEA
eukprot:3720591-Prymnesium_polylepis.1